MTSDAPPVAIVTGASEGIGRALALELARSGDYRKLVISARNRERLDSLADALREHGADVLIVPTDVTQPKACAQLIEQTLARFGRIDTLFNNAGATMWATFEETHDLSVFRRVMDVNYFGALYCTKSALAALQKSRGRIVLIASVAGLTGVPSRSGYAASKHAAIGLFESLRIELAATGVSVTIVAPDFVVSSIHKRALTGDGAVLGESPMREGKIMTAERCAQLTARAARGRRRLLITSLRGRLGRVVRLFAPRLIDRIAARAIDQGH